jgi:hypothetical protein
LNVASGQPCTVLEMASHLAAAVDPALAPEVAGGFAGPPSRGGQRGRSRLGFVAEIGPAAGLAAFATARCGSRSAGDECQPNQNHSTNTSTRPVR